LHLAGEEMVSLEVCVRERDLMTSSVILVTDQLNAPILVL